MNANKEDYIIAAAGIVMKQTEAIMERANNSAFEEGTKEDPDFETVEEYIGYFRGLLANAFVIAADELRGQQAAKGGNNEQRPKSM